MSFVGLNSLKDPKTSLTELSRILGEFERSVKFETDFRIGISANITAELATNAIKKYAYLQGHRPEIVQGSYDAHMDNLKIFQNKGLDYILMVQCFDNLLPSLESTVIHKNSEFIEQLMERFRKELQLFLNNAKIFKTVFITSFHRLSRPEPSRESCRIDELIDLFNRAMKNEVVNFKNVKWIDTEAVLATLGWKNSIDARFYYKFKSPYTYLFWDELVRQVFLISRGGNHYFYKCLVLDCDNTLWGGIVGEDLLDGIQLGPHDYPGNIYWTIQNQILELQKHGVLLCLSSKNNPGDVDEILAKHPYSVLRDQNFILKKVNWQSKVENIKAIASDLNIGLESLVFLDDSSFECNAVQSQLPSVRVFQVPKNIFEYPAVFQEVRELFLSGSVTAEAIEKTAQYRRLAMAAAERGNFGSQEEYLRSLGIVVDLKVDVTTQVARIAELTQKSNQFNLTTRRYTEGEINALMESASASVYLLNVSDRFGDHGLTGVVIVRYENENLEIENFLMSCRVIGRGVEFAFWNFIFDEATQKGCKWVTAKFIKSQKNAQVLEYYDQLGLNLIDAQENTRHYKMRLHCFNLNTQNHIKVNYEQQHQFSGR